MACLLDWLERCTGIAKVKILNPKQAWIFFQAFLFAYNMKGGRVIFSLV